MVLTLWYHLTQIVVQKRPLNGCSSNSYGVLDGPVVDCCKTVKVRKTSPGMVWKCKECHLVALTLLHATLFVADQVTVAQWLVHLTVV